MKKRHLSLLVTIILSLCLAGSAFAAEAWDLFGSESGSESLDMVSQDQDDTDAGQAPSDWTDLFGSGAVEEISDPVFQKEKFLLRKYCQHNNEEFHNFFDPDRPRLRLHLLCTYPYI